MNTIKLLWDAANPAHRRALPILSFPATQKLGITVKELTQSAQLQAKAMALVAKETPTVAAVGLMDLSMEAEAFGASVRFCGQRGARRHGPIGERRSRRRSA